MIEKYKFQKLTVYQLALVYIDRVNDLIIDLPESERFNLSSQIRRAATSIALNIAEGSTSQSDPEQHLFLGLALRSYLETIACLDLVEQRSYLDKQQMNQLREEGHQVFMKLIAFRKSLKSGVQ
jgi:four helix bundle protein